MTGVESGEDGARLDVWLWRARFFKTRALAALQVSGKGVRLTRAGQTRRISKPGTRLSAGDVLSFGRGRHIVSLEIVDLGTRRGPASEAQALYRRLDEDEDRAHD